MKLQFFALNAILILLINTSWSQYKDETDRYFEISKNMEIYNQVIKELNNDYIKNIDPNRMLNVGLNAMLEDLDPYTVFYSESDLEDFRLESQGNIESLGISIVNKNKKIIISNIQKESPLVSKNIPIGSTILKINGMSLEGKSEDEINSLFSSSSTIQLLIRNLNEKEEQIELKRKVSNFASLRAAELIGSEENIAYISLSQFIQSSEAEIRRELERMKKEKDLKGIILDLRGNPGGLLDQAIKVSNLFIPKNEVVVSVEGKDENQKQVLTTQRDAWNAELPLVVLINHQSASASEIVSGTIQDMDRGVVLGDRSYGKGLVQNIRPLGYNTRLKLTTAYYYTPSGRSIQSIDYAQKNEDGSVAHIPEERRKTFLTKNGRKVKDGGGIDPDIFIEEEKANPLIVALKSNYIIFDFATQYYKKNQEKPSIENFKLSEKDWEAFKTFVMQNELATEILLGKEWKNWKQQFTKENKDKEINHLLNNFEKDLESLQKSLIEKNKNAIEFAIGKEIIKRYYFEEGVHKYIFHHPNASLEKAIELIEMPNLYKNILEKK